MPSVLQGKCGFKCLYRAFWACAVLPEYLGISADMIPIYGTKQGCQMIPDVKHLVTFAFFTLHCTPKQPSHHRNQVPAHNDQDHSKQVYLAPLADEHLSGIKIEKERGEGGREGGREGRIRGVSK
jgi:hypothetical protein